MRVALRFMACETSSGDKKSTELAGEEVLIWRELPANLLDGRRNKFEGESLQSLAHILNIGEN